MAPCCSRPEPARTDEQLAGALSYIQRIDVWRAQYPGGPSTSNYGLITYHTDRRNFLDGLVAEVERKGPDAARELINQLGKWREEWDKSNEPGTYSRVLGSETIGMVDYFRSSLEDLISRSWYEQNLQPILKFRLATQDEMEQYSHKLAVGLVMTRDVKRWWVEPVADEKKVDALLSLYNRSEDSIEKSLVILALSHTRSIHVSDLGWTGYMAEETAWNILNEIPPPYALEMIGVSLGSRGLTKPIPDSMKRGRTYEKVCQFSFSRCVMVPGSRKIYPVTDHMVYFIDHRSDPDLSFPRKTCKFLREQCPPWPPWRLE